MSVWHSVFCVCGHKYDMHYVKNYYYTKNRDIGNVSLYGCDGVQEDCSSGVLCECKGYESKVITEKEWDE